ncbi:MAG TPA: ATP-binding protein [Alphaproteobacteria bacterium]
MRLTDLLRTTSFRLAVLFLTLFSAASLLLFGFLYWQTERYLTGEVDDWLVRESTGRAAEKPHELAEGLTEHTALDPAGRRPFALFDSTGQRLAGGPVTLPSPLPPMDEPFAFTQTRDGRPVLLRGMARQLSTGDIVLVSQDMHDVDRFSDLLTDAMAWGWLLVLAVGLAGAAVIGVSALRRIDAVTRSIERIVMGDLSQRLPVDGIRGDLVRLSEIVNRMLDDIQRLMSEVKGVTDDIAHDLRTPLTRLLAGLDRARRRANTPEDYAAIVNDAIAETQGILRTFSAMLRISEVEDGARRAGFTKVDLSGILSDVAELYAPLAEEKGVVLSIADAPAKPVAMAGDPSLLFEAIGNLVDNAIKFTPVCGCVTLRTFRRNGWIGVTVADSGPGIPASERDAVLRRFYRVEKSRHTPGSGLGLSLVAAVAKLHGLRVTIEDAGPGCSITLARDEAPAALPSRQPAAAIASSITRPRAVST